MSTYAWIVCGLAAFEAVIVALFVLLLYSHPFLDRKGRITTGIALSGFIVHAVVFFEGAILIVQLATLALIYIALALCPSKPQPTDGARSRT
jgi:hypothetical protein